MLAGVKLELGDSGVAASQTYTPTNTNVGPQIGALAAAKCQVVVAATVPGLHRPGARHGGGAQVRAAVGRLQRRRRLRHRRRPARQGCPAAGGRHQRRLPAGRVRHRATRGSRCSRRSTRSSTTTRRGTATLSTAWRSATSSCRRCRRPARTRRARRSSRRSRRTASPARASCRCAFSKSDHSGYTGVRLAKITGGAGVFFGPTYTTDDGSGPVTEYNGTEGTPPANGIPSRADRRGR